MCSWPAGPGSIEGFGESFRPNANGGLVSYEVKLELPPAVNGHSPDLSLVYNGGTGNGPFGIGWSVPILYIQRQTRKGLPTYTDQDTFVNANQEELVPLADGTFRSKNAGDRARFRRVATHWEERAKNGTRMIFGQSASARINTPEGVFQWLLEQSIDGNGNVIEFTYLQDQGQAYLKEVRYSIFGDNFNSIVFNYEARPDPLSEYHSRYRVTTALRCSSIEIRSRGALQRRYMLEYPAGATLSLLQRVTQYGRDERTAVPPQTFRYTGPPTRPVLMPMANSPRISFSDTPNIEVVDMNGDGLPDLLIAEKGSYRYFRNLGRGQWERPATRMENSPPFDFESPENVLGDFSGNCLTDVAHKGEDFFLYPNLGDNRFGPRVYFQNNPAYQLSDPSVKLVDLNFDGRPDVLQSIWSGGENRFYAWINLGNNRWSERIELARPDSNRTLLLSDPRVQLADMNGDRLLDLVWISSGQIEYYPLKGYNRLGGVRQSLFDTKVVVQAAPVFSSKNPPRLVDVNGDGLADLVLVEPGRVRFWMNLGNNRFGPEQVVNGTPGLAGGFRFVDLLGSGTTGVLWYDLSAQQQVYLDFVNGLKPNLLNKVENGRGQETYFEYRSSADYYSGSLRASNPWCSAPPFSLPVWSRRRVKDLNSNQEYITDFEYRDGYYNASAREFRGFEFVKIIERGDGTAPLLVTLYQYDIGKTEESRKGKLLRTETLSEDFALRCVRQPDGTTVPVWPDDNQLFRQKVYTYVTRTLYTGTDGVAVKYSFNDYKSTLVFEKTDQPREIAEEFDYDNFGNEIKHIEYNDITDGIIASQERVTLTEYAVNMDAYIVDRPSRKNVTDGDGQFVSETLLYYDGPDYIGLPRGQITRGNLTRKSQRLGPSSTSGDRFINVERKRYDLYGNVIGILDGLGDANNPAAGHARSITYDPVFHTYPIEERTYQEGGRSLVISTEYDYGFGVVTSATDPAGQRTRYVYDALARLIAVVKPGDTLALPTEQYTYTLANPVSNIRTERRERSGQPGMVTTIQYMDGLGRKLQMKEPAGSNRFVIKEAVTYNLRGREKEKYLPYFTNTFDYEPPDPSKPKIQMVYDSLGRETQVMQPVGGFTRNVYRPLQRVMYDEENTNPMSPHYDKPRILTDDGFDRLVRLDERNGSATYTTTYGYDLLNNLNYVQDALGNITVLSYDGLKRQMGRQDPDRTPLRFTYDDAGNLVERVDVNGQVVRNSYDALNRIKTQDFVIDTVMARYATYHYDNDLPPNHRELSNTAGRLAYVEDLTGRSLFSYDARGRTIAEIRDVTDLDQYTTQFTYDAMDRITSVTYPDGMVVTYTYDTRGLVAAVSGYAPEIEYTAVGQLARIRYQNRAEATYSYDARQRLVSLRTLSPGAIPNVIQDLRYTLDGVGNVLSIVDGRPGLTDGHNATEDLVYDDVYRLTQARGRYGEINLTYNSINNLTSKTSSVADPNLNIGMIAYDGKGPHQATRAGERDYVYDDGGNVLKRTGFVYTWDVKNRLVSALDEANTQTNFAYDYANRRVLKITGEDMVVYINKYAELRAGHLIKYVFVNDRRVAEIHDQGVAYYHSDHLGSANIITNANGAIIERIQYYAYGTERTREGSFRAAYRYVDREVDESTGLYYMGARYYAHELGMFLSMDPSNFDKALTQTLNPYDYNLHNPYKYLDPNSRLF
jgi:RHS repeat-associated protein